MRSIITFTVFLLLPVTVLSQDTPREWIKVYFNMPGYTADGKVPVGLNDNYDLIGTLVDLIDSAVVSVDLSIYDLEHPRIAESLIRAKYRGVFIRLITDSRNRDDSRELDPPMWNRLGDAGIYSMDDDGDIYRSATDIVDYDLVNDGADMHNKFAIIDARDNDPDNDLVWTGSTNLTYTGAYNTNNVIVIKDSEIATIYEQEFEQMWGGSGNNPTPENARFHKDKADVTQHVFDVGGTKVELYFAPINRDRSKPSISDRLVQLVNDEVQSDIKFQAFSFTPNIPLAEAIWQKTANENIDLKGVIDPSFYSRYRNAKQIWGSAEAQSGNRMVLPARETRKLHHKILLLDADNPDSGDVAVVVTGSYNFSKNAEENNDENLLIIYSDEIAELYNADFSGAFGRASGTLQAPAPPVNSEFWYEVYAINDGSRFEIEVLPGFGYPIRFLGITVPTLYAGQDSSYYFSGAAAEYLSNILTGRKVRISGPGGGVPYHTRGTYFAYVEVEYDGAILALNQRLLKNGLATTNNYFNQHPDSVERFKIYQTLAEENNEGLWRREKRIGTKVARSSEVSSSAAVEVLFPININTADQATLQLLPGIGEAYAKRIIDYREQNGGFKKIEELLEIRGIGERRFERLRPVVTL